MLRRRLRRAAAAPGLFIALVLLPSACGGGAAEGGSPTGPGMPAPTATSVKFATAAPTLDRWGDTATVVALVYDQNGQAMASRSVTYQSSDTTVVRVSSAGQLVSWKAGTATITASGAGLTATLDATVAVQRNSACKVPSAPGTPGPAAAPFTYTAIEGPTGSMGFSGMAVAFDVNADGKTDVLTVGQDPVDPSTYSEALAYLGNGDGTFTDDTAQIFPNGALPFNGPRDYKLIDVNGDRRLDLYIANPGYDPGGIDGKSCGDGVTDCGGAPNALLLANPGGGLTDVSASALTPNPSNGFTHAADMADIDCDGDPDLFEGQWASAQANAPSDLKVNTAGLFANDNTRLSGWNVGASAAGVAFCDLDADGDPDLVIGPPPGQVRVLVNDGFGHFRASPESTLPAPRSSPSEAIATDIGCADLDRDGYNEIVYHDHSFNANFGKWTVIHNDGNMAFSDWNSVLPNPEAAYGIPVGSGSNAMMYDLNGDGWIDMLTGDATTPLRILWNTGGAFVEQTLYDRGGGAVMGNATAVGDFNGDGKLDIFLDPGHQYQGTVLMAN